MKPIDRFQAAINYQFNSPDLLGAALRHRSLGSRHNERLEFLGDSILGLVISKALFDRFPDATEGELTRMRAQLVRQASLAEIARRLDLGAALQLGPSAGKSGGSDRASILADALEAVFAAVHLDSGFNEAGAVILRVFQSDLAAIQVNQISKDPKTTLQEVLQASGRPLPEYVVRETFGDPHDREFVVECVLTDDSLVKRGRGPSRKVAEQRAAAEILIALGLDTAWND